MIYDSIPADQNFLSKMGIRTFYTVYTNKYLAAGTLQKWGKVQ